MGGGGGRRGKVGEENTEMGEWGREEGIKRD